jgi:hypothetical protein
VIKLLRFTTLILFALFLSFLVYYAHWAILHICPVFDGNTCVSVTSNIGLLLERSQFFAAAQRLDDNWNNFLSIIYFGIFSAFFGPGRIAWGWGWAGACLGCVILQIRILKNNCHWQQVILAFLIAAISTPLLATSGGLLDQRFDPFALLCLLLAAASLLAKRTMLSLFFSIAAVFAKGPALPLSILFWLSAFATRLLTFQQLKTAILNNKIAFSSSILLIIIYKIWFLTSVVNYNLMATDHSTGQFLMTAIHYIAVSHFFYFKSLYHQSPFYLVLIFYAFVAIFQNKNNKPLAYFGLLFFIFTYLLFSAHPVRTDVLAIWFLPSIWILSYLFAGSIQKNTFLSGLTIIMVISQMMITINQIKTHIPYHLKTYQTYYQQLREQAQSLAQELNTHPNMADKTIRLLPNFVSSPEPGFIFASATYKVLMFETLGRSSPILEGWDLGNTDNWLESISLTPKNEIFLTIILSKAENKINSPLKVNKIANDYIKQVNVNCETQNIQHPYMKEFGKFRFFLTQHVSNKCV